MKRLSLQNVTLCAASDVALEATMQAMEHCVEQVDFRDAILLSSRPLPRRPKHDIRHETIPPLNSREAYSRFVLTDLASHISTDFALIVQWDGFIIDPSAWTDTFLEYDYIGAPWLNQPANLSVGNGGFSLRSKRLLAAGSEAWFEVTHPEDLCICRQNRGRLEDLGIRIADLGLARLFSREREQIAARHFGVHGVFALAEIMEEKEFISFLLSIEPGVIGKRELLDVINIRRIKYSGGHASTLRCSMEFLKRFPFDRRSPKLAAQILKDIIVDR
jgi:hypothetical protein